MILNPRKYKEFNELFAEYIGCTKDEEGNFKFSDGSKMTKTMHFHDRWDWLMMVVEKIPLAIEIAAERTVRVPYSNIMSDEEKTLILNMYNVCYQYIKKLKND